MGVDLTGPPLPRAAAWALVADPDHLFRVAGLPPVRGALCALPGERAVFRGELLGPAGLRHKVVELEQAWVRDDHHLFLWRLDGPALRRLRFEGRLLGEGETRAVRLRLDWELESSLLAPALWPVGALVTRAWTSLLRDEAIRGPGKRRSLERQTQVALSRLLDRGAPMGFLGALRSWLERSPRALLHRIEPGALAEAAEIPVDAALRWMVEGVSLGLFDLAYLLRCDGCSLIAGEAGRLDALLHVGACPFCARAPRVDLSETVEIAFDACFGQPGGGIEGAFCPASAPELAASTATATGRSLVPGPSGAATRVSAWRLLTDPLAARRLGPPALGIHKALPVGRAGLLLCGLVDEKGLYAELGDEAAMAALVELDEAISAVVDSIGVIVDRGAGIWLVALAEGSVGEGLAPALTRAARIWAAGLPGSVRPEAALWVRVGEGPAVAAGDSERALSLYGGQIAALRAAGG